MLSKLLASPWPLNFMSTAGFTRWPSTTIVPWRRHSAYPLSDSTLPAIAPAEPDRVSATTVAESHWVFIDASWAAAGVQAPLQLRPWPEVPLRRGVAGGCERAHMSSGV